MATILFLTHRIPYPPNKGDKLRAYQLLKHWTQEHQIFLGCFVEDPDDWRHTEMLRSQCAGTYFARLNLNPRTFAISGSIAQQRTAERTVLSGSRSGSLGREGARYDQARLRLYLFVRHGSIRSWRGLSATARSHGLC